MVEMHRSSNPFQIKKAFCVAREKVLLIKEVANTSSPDIVDADSNLVMREDSEGGVGLVPSSYIAL
jgi:hypothetical protein